MTADRPLVIHPKDWALRAAPRGVLPHYLGTELTAVTLTPTLALVWPDVTGADWSRFAALLGLGLAQAELSRRTETIRRYFAGMPHVNMTSVWIYGGALLLPPLLAALLVTAIYGHLWLRVWRPIKHRPAYRVLFSASTMVLACLAVAPVLRLLGVGATLVDSQPDLRAVAGVILGITAFTTINSVLIMVGLKLHNPDRTFLPLVGSWADNALELATLCLGGITAALLLSHPLFAPLILLPVAVLHRLVLMRQLEEAATQDAKTGLLTDEEWRNRAATELARARRRRDGFAVLFVDLDNFKRINDTHGHAVGDEVLRQFAAAIRAEVRAYDSVGRFGGDECVVLLPEIPKAAAHAVAERIRDAIARLDITLDIDEKSTVITGLSASIGIATYPEASTVDKLVSLADTAMYRAKENGRNQVASA